MYNIRDYVKAILKSNSTDNGEGRELEEINVCILIAINY